MPKRPDIKKVLLIGSGPIQIGQAAEFDFSGSQACKSLREEGVEVVLVNSNPATIMTDPEMADRIYIEPLVPEVVAKIIERERPDGIIAGIGGQTGLNVTSELAEGGVLDQFGVEVLGTSVSAIRETEDRDLFKRAMIRIGEPVPKSRAVDTLGEAKEALKELGLPLIIRPAYTLGGSGGGSAETEEEFFRIVEMGMKRSRIHQVLVEESLVGWTELEYEVMRDKNDTCITICNMENMDPMGIHTGESIVVTPIQTLTDDEVQILRTAAINIIRALKIEGGCNILYVELVRGIPTLVLVYYMALALIPQIIYGVNDLGEWLSHLAITIHLTGDTAYTITFIDTGNRLAEFQTREFPNTYRAIIGLAISYSAFLSEIFRAGIDSVGEGQREAAQSLGMTRWQMMRLIVLPQAFRTILPPLGNDFIALLKESSLVSVLGVTDITRRGQTYASSTFTFFQSYNVVALTYLTLTLALSMAVKGMEWYLDRGKKRMS